MNCLSRKGGSLNRELILLAVVGLSGCYPAGSAGPDGGKRVSTGSQPVVQDERVYIYDGADDKALRHSLSVELVAPHLQDSNSAITGARRDSQKGTLWLLDGAGRAVLVVDDRRFLSNGTPKVFKSVRGIDTTTVELVYSPNEPRSEYEFVIDIRRGSVLYAVPVLVGGGS